MVSKASEDLPEPDSPVITTSESRGKVTSTFFRLCSRAPRTASTARDGAGAASPGALRAAFGPARRAAARFGPAVLEPDRRELISAF